MRPRTYILIVAVAVVLFVAIVYVNGIISGIDRQYSRIIKEKDAEITAMREKIDSIWMINIELEREYEGLSDSVAMYIGMIADRDKKIQEIKNESAINYVRINTADIGGVFELFSRIDTSRIRH